MLSDFDEPFTVYSKPPHGQAVRVSDQSKNILFKSILPWEKFPGPAKEPSPWIGPGQNIVRLRYPFDHALSATYGGSSESFAAIGEHFGRGMF